MKPITRLDRVFAVILLLPLAPGPTELSGQLSTRMTRAYRAQAAAADSLIRSGDWSSATAELRTQLDANPENLYARWRLALAERLGGDCAAARRAYVRLSDTPEYGLMSSFWAGVMSACLGRDEEALEWLTVAADRGYATIEFAHGDLVRLRTTRELAGLRERPEYRSLVRRLTTRSLPNLIRDPEWSPDGREIAFAGALDGEANFDIWVVGSDGSGLRRITRTLDSDHGPSWSADGRHLLFSRTRVSPPGGSELFVVGRDGDDERRLIDRGALAGNKWQGRFTPDGSRIVLVGDATGARQIYEMNAAGTEVTQRTSDPGDKANPSVGPAGTLLYDVRGTGDEYVVRSLDAGAPSATTVFDKAWWTRPRWSPTGDAVLLNYFDTGVAQLGHVVIAQPDGTGARLLLPDTIGTSSGSWSPDGRSVAFVRYRQAHTRGGTELWTADRSGRALRRLIGAGDGRSGSR